MQTYNFSRVNIYCLVFTYTYHRCIFFVYLWCELHGYDVLHLFSSWMLSVISYKEPVPKNESPQPSPDLATTRDNKVGRWQHCILHYFVHVSGWHVISLGILRQLSTWGYLYYRLVLLVVNISFSIWQRGTTQYHRHSEMDFFCLIIWLTCKQKHTRGVHYVVAVHM